MGAVHLTHMCCMHPPHLDNLLHCCVLEDKPGIPTTDLFGDRELYTAEGESGDSESSLD